MNCVCKQARSVDQSLLATSPLILLEVSRAAGTAGVSVKFCRCFDPFKFNLIALLTKSIVMCACT